MTEWPHLTSTEWPPFILTRWPSLSSVEWHPSILTEWLSLSSVKKISKCLYSMAFFTAIKHSLYRVQWQKVIISIDGKIIVLFVLLNILYLWTWKLWNFTMAGTRCESVMDLCLSSPCQNAGTCVQTGSAYVCNCSATFTGRHCEDMIVLPNVSSSAGGIESKEIYIIVGKNPIVLILLIWYHTKFLLISS